MEQRTAALIAVLTALAPISPTPAQVPSDNYAENRGLEEIVVTAERREASLQAVPIAVSALTAETLENRQIAKYEDLQRFVPSLRMSNAPTSRTNLAPSLRGSTQQDAALVVAESPFGIYVDDVYVGRLNGNNVSLNDVERVEVLRGPQGTLYGRNTLSGALKFVTRTPGDEAWFNTRIGVGNFDQYLASVSAGGPIDSNWAASLSAKIDSKDGEFYNVATDREFGLERNVAARAKLHYMGGDIFDAVLSVSSSDSKNDAMPMIPGATPNDPLNQRQFTSDDVVPVYGFYRTSTPYLTGSPDPIALQPQGHTKQTIAGLSMSWDLGSATLRSITGLVKLNDSFTNDFSGRGWLYIGSRAASDQFTQELQIQGAAFEDRLQYIVGAYYLNEEADQKFGYGADLGALATGAASVRMGLSTSVLSIETRSIAGFGQLDYSLTDKLKVTAGARWVEDKKEFNAAYQFLLAPLPVDTVAVDDVYSEFTPKFGVDYSLDAGETIDSMLVYASAAKGFKSGGYTGIMIFPDQVNDARTSYAPESNWTYEIGAKVDLFDHRLRVNSAVFYADVSDLALIAAATVNGQPSFPVQNAGDATIRGLELEVTATPVSGLVLFLNAALLDGKYDRLNPTANAATAPARFGFAESVPPQLPDYTVTLGFDYGFDVTLGSLGGRASVGADYYKTDDHPIGSSNDYIISAYDRVNAFIGLQAGEHWDLRFSVANLTDEETRHSGDRNFGAYMHMPPREYMFSIGYEFQ